MPWLDLDAELSEAFGQLHETANNRYQAAAYAEYERRKVVRKAHARDLRAIDRLRRVRFRIEPLPCAHVCLCGEAYASPQALVLHRHRCRWGVAWDLEVAKAGDACEG